MSLVKAVPPADGIESVDDAFFAFLRTPAPGGCLTFHLEYHPLAVPEVVLNSTCASDVSQFTEESLSSMQIHRRGEVLADCSARLAAYSDDTASPCQWRCRHIVLYHQYCRFLVVIRVMLRVTSEQMKLASEATKPVHLFFMATTLCTSR